MSTTIRPQDDLYRAVNADWLATATIPDHLPGWSPFFELIERADDAMRELISTADGEPGSNERKVADLFASFMDTDRAEELGRAPLEPLLTRIDGLTEVSGLMHLLGEFHHLGVRSLIAVDVDSDPGDPQRAALFVAQSGLGLPDEEFYRLEEHAETREKYLAHVERTLALTGAADAAVQAAVVVDLEARIAQLHWDKVRCREMTEMYNPMSLAELVEASAGVAWSEFFTGLGLDIESDLGQIINAQPSFFAGLGELLDEEHLPAWRAWARWQVTSSLSPYLSSDFVDEQFSFYGAVLSGLVTNRERWKRGVKLVEGALGHATGQLYVAQHFRPETKKRVLAMVDDLLRAYRASITDLDWMTDATRAEALTKLENFRPKIGYPDEWIDYSALDIDATDLIGNVQRAAAFETDRQLAKINRPVDRNEWFMLPQTVNAYYHPLRNEIVFPAAICQPPYFDPEADDASNYGGLGAIIGHEIGHGFDDQGSTCDGSGLLRNWWTDADREAFTQRTGVLVDQYAVLSPEGADGQRVNGELTLGENIGDLGGLSIAHLAWLLTEPDDVEAGARRLFESWARAWATLRRPESVKQLLAIDPHSPPEFRCNQVVRNIDAFHEAFGTGPDDGLWLAPEERVRIW